MLPCHLSTASPHDLLTCRECCTLPYTVYCGMQHTLYMLIASDILQIEFNRHGSRDTAATPTHYKSGYNQPPITRARSIEPED